MGYYNDLVAGTKADEIILRKKGDVLMKKQDLQTPAIIVELDALKNNIKVYQEEANKYRKEIWPMLKTHKSTEITKMQMEAGATGVLCGTLDEVEAAAAAGIEKIMYAYPVASQQSIKRVIKVTKECDLIIRLDDIEAAKLINEAAVKAGVKVSYTIIIDVGLNRFGIVPTDAVKFADSIKGFEGLRLRGISTHPGHVYSATKGEEVAEYVAAETENLKLVADALREAGYELEYISSGSTPTFWGAIDDEYINVYHPGNYVFHDVIQMSLDIAKEEDCSLSVLATIISNPREGVFICDAGTKCLGLDQGAHGNTSIKGYGVVKGHPEILVGSLSEEVGKLYYEGEATLKVGDKIEIIPNHSCSAANFTNYLITTNKDEVVGSIKVDIRGNSTLKNINI